MKDQNYTATKTAEIRLAHRSPEYWRVTFDHPPLNIFGPETIPQLNEIVTALETDKHVKVVVFDSAVEGYFLTHYDFLAALENTTRLPPGPTGLQPLPDMLVRLSRAPVVSIASIRGRATGEALEKALALDDVPSDDVRSVGLRDAAIESLKSRYSKCICAQAQGRPTRSVRSPRRGCTRPRRSRR